MLEGGIHAIIHRKGGSRLSPTGLLAAPADLAATAWQQAIQGAAEQASNFAYIIYVSLSTRHRGSGKMHRLPLHYTTVF